jgi:hypothetical protein
VDRVGLSWVISPWLDFDGFRFSSWFSFSLS